MHLTQKMIAVCWCAFSLIYFAAISSDQAHANSDKIELDIRINNISHINIKENYFILDCDIHFWWDKNNFDPKKNFSIHNPYRRWKSFQSTAFEKPKLLSDGRHYQIVRYEGMITSILKHKDFPFEKFTLTADFLIETQKGLNISVINPKPLIASEITASGFKASDTSVTLRPSRTAFQKGSGAEILKMSFEIDRKAYAVGVKILLALIIVTITGLLSLLLDIELVAAKVSLLATALLSLIVLQSTTTPSISYLTLIDKTFILGRLLVGVALLRTVFTHTNICHNHAKKLHNRDRKLFVFLVLALIIGTVSIIIYHKFIAA